MHLQSADDASSLHTFRSHMDHSHFAFAPSEHDVDVNGPFGWEILGEAVTPARDSPCRCLESALSVTLSIKQGLGSPYPGAMDLALDVEAQLRETVPIAVQCPMCKPRQGEILKLFSDAIADVIELLQQLCSAEFADSVDSQWQRASSTIDGLEWLQPKPSGRDLPSLPQLPSHSRNTSRSMLHMNGSSNGASDSRRGSVNGNGTGRRHPHELPPITKTDSSDLQANYRSDMGGWRVLVGRHLIVGDDRKFMLMHLLRRRLSALSQVLEGLIRAMQDLRMALRQEESFRYDDHTASRVAEIDTRKPLQTASKLYDIIDKLEMIQV
jgi:hypothetical protein